MNSKPNRKIQFDSDQLVAQIETGRKTASVTRLGEVDVAEDDYNV